MVWIERTVVRRPRDVRVGDALVVGGMLSRVTEVDHVHGGARLHLDCGGMLVASSAVKYEIRQRRRAGAQTW